MLVGFVLPISLSFARIADLHWALLLLVVEKGFRLAEVFANAANRLPALDEGRQDEPENQRRKDEAGRDLVRWLSSSPHDGPPPSAQSVPYISLTTLRLVRQVMEAARPNAEPLSLAMGAGTASGGELGKGLGPPTRNRVRARHARAGHASVPVGFDVGEDTKDH